MKDTFLLLRKRAFLLSLLLILGVVISGYIFVYQENIRIYIEDLKWHDKKIDLGLSFENPPLAFSDNNKLKGFAVDYIENLNIANKFTLQLYPAPSDQKEIYSELISGVYDIALVNKAYLKDEQLQNLYVSRPFFTSRQALVLRMGEKLPERKMQMRAGEAYYAPFDLSLLNNKSLGIQKDTLGEKVSNQLIANKKIKGVFIAEFPDDKSLFSALLNKTVDAVISDIPCKQKTSWPLWKKIRVEYDYLSYEEYVFIVKRSNPGLRRLIDRQFKIAKNNGLYEELFAKWFG